MTDKAIYYTLWKMDYSYVTVTDLSGEDIEGYVVVFDSFFKPKQMINNVV